ncbi:hypothetical protein AAG906_005587 [Vitis piasezkii]
MRGSACVEVMTTLHGSTPSLLRRAEGCIPLEGMIASARDLLKTPPYTWVHPRAFRASIAAALDPIFPPSSLQLRDRTFVPRLDIPLWIGGRRSTSGSGFLLSRYSFVDRVEAISSGLILQIWISELSRLIAHGRHGFYPEALTTAIRDETPYDSHPPPPPLPASLMHRASPYVLHGTRDHSTRSHPGPGR